MAQKTQDNIFFKAQQECCDTLNSLSSLSAISFFPEDTKDLENQITTALRKQGICARILLTDASFAGLKDGLNMTWNVDTFAIQVIENPSINRANNNRNFHGTAQDVAELAARVLGSGEYGLYGRYVADTYTVDEKDGLIIATVIFKCALITEVSGYVPPEPHPPIWQPFALKSDLDALSTYTISTFVNVNSDIDQIRQNFSSFYTKEQSDNRFLKEDSLSNVVKQDDLSAYYTKIQVDNKLTSYASKSDISGITTLIPEQATSENKLADKNFVNSSIATETSYFKGTFTNLSDLTSTVATNNDYAFLSVVEEGNTLFKRYKYTNLSGWLFEYSLNNSSFTANQWAAINSGITQNVVDDIATKTWTNEQLNLKADSISVYNKSELSVVNLSGTYVDETTFSFNLLQVI